MLTERRLSGRAWGREGDEIRAIPGRQGLSRCTCIRTCKHTTLLLAACSLQRNRSNWVNETPSLLTHVRTHTLARCKRTVYTQVSYMRNARECRFWISVPSAPDKRRTYWHFTKASHKLPRRREYPAIFAAGLIRLSRIRRRHVTASASGRHTLIDPIWRRDTFIAVICM